MIIEKEAASDTRKSVAIIGTGVITALCVIYLGYSWLNSPPVARSVYDINKVATNAGRTTTESPEYRELLEKYNTEKAAKARQEGKSFVAQIRQGSEGAGAKTLTTPQSVILNQTPPATTAGAAQVQQQVPAFSENRKKAIDSLLKELNSHWSPVGFQLASAAGGNEGAAGEGQSGAFSQWTSSLSSPTPSRQSFDDSNMPDIQLIPPYTRTPGVIETAVDSDNPGSQVIARIPAGPYAGAMLHASSVQLAGDGVNIHFTRMAWGGETYTVDAYALSDETLQSSVASNVNNRYFSRIILPALAMGIGRTGQLYEQANSQNIITPQGGIIQTSTGTPNGSAVAGTIVGGIGSQAGQVMASDAARLPVKQATVEPNQVIAIQFIGGVYQSDNIRSKSGQQKIQQQTQAQPRQLTSQSPPVTAQPTTLNRTPSPYTPRYDNR
ncbi:conjugal transfer protein TraO [Yersinia similis]|uniref:conjugal transfer protein TraO n=1 Tax=Yersinia similis TaxID=367190 RepID=UPI00061C251D|nr:conjugal transfer protein TraO [Yersinia similis]CNB82767.1 Uncharacterised protein [Yersinia similis]